MEASSPVQEWRYHTTSIQSVVYEKSGFIFAVEFGASPALCRARGLVPGWPPILGSEALRPAACAAPGRLAPTTFY